MIKVWIIYMMLVGAPTKDNQEFTTATGCNLYLRVTYAEVIRDAFKLVCVERERDANSQK